MFSPAPFQDFSANTTSFSFTASDENAPAFSLDNRMPVSLCNGVVTVTTCFANTFPVRGRGARCVTNASADASGSVITFASSNIIGTATSYYANVANANSTKPGISGFVKAPISHVIVAIKSSDAGSSTITPASSHVCTTTTTSYASVTTTNPARSEVGGFTITSAISQVTVAAMTTVTSQFTQGSMMTTSTKTDFSSVVPLRSI